VLTTWQSPGLTENPIWEKHVRDLGCVGCPELGGKAMHGSAGEVLEEIANANIIFLVAGMVGAQALQ